MTEQTVTRRTSIYTLRTPHVTHTVARMRSAGLPVADQGEASVSFRADGDDAALAVIERVAQPWRGGSAWELTTGLGVHRRTVAQEAAGVR